MLNKNGHKGSIIGKACGWTSNSGDQLGDAGVSVNVELSVSFELVKYLLALVGLVGSYDIITEAIMRRARLATTLTEHLGVTCSARVRVVREIMVCGCIVARPETSPRRLVRPQVPPVSGRRRRHAAVVQQQQGARPEQRAHLRTLLPRYGTIKCGLKFQTMHGD